MTVDGKVHLRNVAVAAGPSNENLFALCGPIQREAFRFVGITDWVGWRNASSGQIIIDAITVTGVQSGAKVIMDCGADVT